MFSEFCSTLFLRAWLAILQVDSHLSPALVIMSNRRVAEILQQAIDLLHSDNQGSTNVRHITSAAAEAVPQTLDSVNSQRLGTSVISPLLSAIPSSFNSTSTRTAVSVTSSPSRNMELTSNTSNASDNVGRPSRVLRTLESRLQNVDRSSTSTPRAPYSLRQFRDLRNSEVNNLFRPQSAPRGANNRRGQTSRVYFRKFFVFRLANDALTPMNSKRQRYQENGLGEKVLSLHTNMSTDELRRTICSAFPTLENIEFELLKASAGGPGKQLFPLQSGVPIPTTDIIPVAVRTGIIYVRPTSQNIIEEEKETPDLEDDHAHDDQIENSETAQDCIEDSSMNEFRGSETFGSEINSESSNDALPIDNDIGLEADITTYLDFQKKVFDSNEGTQPIFASREDIIEQVIGFYSKDKEFSILKKPRVMFIGEPGHDIGALTREFFDHTQRALLESRFMGRYPIFEGEDDHKCPSSDVLLLRTGVFQAVGKFMVHSFINTGVAMHSLSPCVMQYILSESDNFDTITEINVNDIPSMEIRHIFNKISNWTQDRPLAEGVLAEAQAEAINCGFFAEISLNNRQLFLDCFLLHHVMHTRKCQLDAIKSVFREQGVLDFLRGKEYLFDAVFPKIASQKYSPSMIIRHMEFLGDTTGRVKMLFQSYIDNMDSETITQFLRCVTSWPYLTETKISVNVGDHPWLTVQACFNTINIPNEMDNETILNTLMQAIRVGGFGSV